MSEVKSWDTSAANNNSASPNGWPENMAPSGVNDSARENMAAIARLYADINGTLDTTGSANTYLLAPNVTYAAYARGDMFRIEINVTNTGASTLNVSSLGAKNILKANGDALLAGDLVAGGVYDVVYDGTQFRLLGGTYQSTFENTLIDLDNSGAGTETSIQARNSEGGISIRTDGGNAQISQTDSAGADQDVWLGMTQNGAVSMYYNGTPGVTTTSTGATVRTTGSTTALNLQDSGGASQGGVIWAGTGTGMRLRGTIDSEDVKLQATDAGSTLRDLFLGDPDGAVELYHAGTKTAETTSNGMEVTAGNATLQLTDGGSENAILQKHNDGYLMIYNREHGGLIYIRGEDGAGNINDGVVVNPGSWVRQYYDGDIVSETTQTGMKLISTTDNPKLTLEDVDNNELVRITTVSDDVYLDARAAGKDVYIRACNAGGSNESGIQVVADGEIILYHDADPMLTTLSNGIQVHDDLELRHDGTDARIRNETTSGHLILQATTSGDANYTGMTIDGDAGVAFNGATPAAPPNYTVTGLSTNRSISNGSGTGDVREVVGTLISDLIAMGLLQ